MHSEEGARLRQIVLDQWPKVTLGEFAGRMGVSPELFSRYINGHRLPPRNFWTAAAAELGVEPGQILSDRISAAR